MQAGQVNHYQALLPGKWNSPEERPCKMQKGTLASIYPFIYLFFSLLNVGMLWAYFSCLLFRGELRINYGFSWGEKYLIFKNEMIRLKFIHHMLLSEVMYSCEQGWTVPGANGPVSRA